MIQCPYCGADMDDNARFCPKCLSMLVAEPDRDAHKPYPVWRHPATALIVIIVLSAGLMFASLKIAPASSKGKDNPAEKKATENPKGGEAAAPGPNPAGAPPPGPAAPPTKSLATGDAPSYEEFTAYETQITTIFAETDALTADIDKLFAKGDDKAADQLADKNKQLQLQVSKLRRIDVPHVLSPIHSKLANALSMLSRGYQEIARFQKSGDTTRLNKARKDIDTARQKRQDALNEVANFKSTLKAPEAAPPPPPADTRPPEPTPPPAPPGPPPAAPPAVNPEGGTDAWGACIPRRLVEVYPTGKIRERIITGLKGQYNSTRLCGDAPGASGPAPTPPPLEPQPPPPPATDNPPPPTGPNGPENPPPPTENPEPPENQPGPDQLPPLPDAPQPEAPQP